MDHFSWVVRKIDEASALGAGHERSSVQVLVDALLGLQGRGAMGMVFGMSIGSLAINGDERGRLIDLLRKALVAKRDAFAKAGEQDLLLELSKVADPCELPQLRYQAPPVEAKHHPDAPWLQDALAGVFVLRGGNTEAAEAAMRMCVTIYKGRDFGGLDFMPPNESGDAWLLLGRWTDCFEPEVQEAALRFLEALERSVRAVNDGTSVVRRGDAVTLSVTSPRPKALTVVPWRAYHGMLALRSGPLDPKKIQHLVRNTFPKLPRWIGMHMGAPHWLGRGVSASDGRIHHVAPYVRVDFPMDGRVELAAMAAEQEFTDWLRSFLQAMPG